MKRIGNLYDQITSLENLRLADEKARRGKLHTYGVQVHDKNREANLQALHEALRGKTYKTSPYEVFTIFEPKERLIYRLPYFPDRIVHHAIMNILEPIFVSYFTHNTYSCIKGRGIEGCARSVRRHIRKYEGRPLYCLKLDIRKFYPTIDHAKLKEILRRKIKDRNLLWLLDEIIDSVNGTVDPLDKSKTVYGRSLPIGNYLSQYLANIYLAPFMHLMNEQWKIDADEYADDITCYSDSKEKLHDAFRTKIKPYLEDELHLKVKGNYQVYPIARNNRDKHGRPLDFVGYQFYREQQLMRKSIKKTFCRATARLNKKAPAPTLEQYKQRICSWLGWAQHSDSKHLLRTIIKKEYQNGIL
jgi:retron-type reverse transcriptase